MAHHIYHTRGVILGSKPSGEANRYYKIFTEELGVLEATAQSVREGRSKLRYVLQDYSLIHVDLVRGKEVWRITSAIEEKPLDLAGGDEQKKLFVKICAFLARLLQGEGQEKLLFNDLRGAIDFFRKEVVPAELIQATEILSALRTLITLGYVDTAGYEDYMTGGEYSLEILRKFEKRMPDAIRSVEEAVISSHL
jgi:recombinational DNA repair protein (RecF pathway)